MGRGNDLRGFARIVAATAFVSMTLGDLAFGYVGPSFVQIPDVDGGWKVEPHKRWLEADSNYWTNSMFMSLGGGGFNRNPAFFAGPAAPIKGPGSLVIAIDKRNPALPRVMELCAHETPFAELRYAESSDLARPSFVEIGPRPAEVPEYFEYKLKNAKFSDCPVVGDAPDQAIVVSFKEVERLNFPADSKGVEVKLIPADVKPLPPSPTTKSFVLTWFADANDVSDNQCPVMNTKPSEDDYYALMSKDDADKEREQNKGKGVNYENGQMGLRGPHKLNVELAPGIVRDPGDPEPQTKVALGLDLDGSDGTGKVPRGICKHQNYMSVDGQPGVDNQLYRAEGCISSFQGHKGFIMQFSNQQMHDGALSLLVQISGMDHEKNNDHVDVAFFASFDPMVKSGTGGQILPNYTYRVTARPEYSHYFNRLRGRLVNGVVTVGPVKDFRIHLPGPGMPSELRLENARMRFQLMPDGSLKGVIGGYQDWRVIASRYIASAAELYHGFQEPGLYNALKRDADGIKDPVSGQCNGISSAYSIEGVPALIGPEARRVVDTAPAHGQTSQTEAQGSRAH